MKRRIDRSSKPIPLVPTASMADIAFLLIIFFMLTTTFSPERTSVSLPDSEKRTEVQQKAAIVAITAAGQLVYTDGEQISRPVVDMEQLGRQVKALVELFPKKEFLIKADQSVRYELVDQVLEELRGAGARNIGLLTDQKVLRSGS